MIDPVRLSFLLLLSLIAVIASLHAWRTHLAYGWCRFVAFELVVLLVVWNTPHWFQNPFSITQITSWVVLTGAALLAAHGFYLLRVVGQAQARLMEETQVVVRIGAYRYMRHPMYGSLLWFGWGVFLKGFDPVSAALATLATVFWVATARYEERFNIERFGATYLDYMRHTKMFVPFVL